MGVEFDPGSPIHLMGIDHEIFSTVILLLLLIQEELVSVTSKVLVNRLVKLAQEKCS